MLAKAKTTSPNLKILVQNGGGPEAQDLIDEYLGGQYKSAKLYERIEEI